MVWNIFQRENTCFCLFCHLPSESASVSGADIPRQVIRVVVLAQIANDSQRVCLVDHLISTNSVPEGPGHTPDTGLKTVSDFSILGMDLSSFRAIDTSLNGCPVYSKLGKALLSSFLGFGGGRHAVEQLNLHHHIGDMVDGAALNHVPGTFPWSVLALKSVSVLSVSMRRSAAVCNKFHIKELR